MVRLFLVYFGVIESVALIYVVYAVFSALIANITAVKLQDLLFIIPLL